MATNSSRDGQGYMQLPFIINILLQTQQSSTCQGGALTAQCLAVRPISKTSALELNFQHMKFRDHKRQHYSRKGWKDDFKHTLEIIGPALFILDMGVSRQETKREALHVDRNTVFTTMSCLESILPEFWCNVLLLPCG